MNLPHEWTLILYQAFDLVRVGFPPKTKKKEEAKQNHYSRRKKTTTTGCALYKTFFPFPFFSSLSPRI